MNRTIATEYIIGLYRKHGQVEYGEQVTQLSHAVQAGLLAREAGLDEELILAAFLHDIGHLIPLEGQEAVVTMGEYGMEAHDKIAEAFLREQGFSERLIAPVRNHVDAKRYLCQSEPGYYGRLSEASRQTLTYQGGPMSDEEAWAFRASLYFEESIRLRRLDEEAKESDFEVRDEHWHYFTRLLESYVAEE